MAKVHRYNEILRILHFLGIAIYKSKCAATAATAYLAHLNRWAQMFRQLYTDISTGVIKASKQVETSPHDF